MPTSASGIKCAVCNDASIKLPTDRVIATQNDDGEIEHTYFCSLSCQSEYHT